MSCIEEDSGDLGLGDGLRPGGIPVKHNITKPPRQKIQSDEKSQYLALTNGDSKEMNGEYSSSVTESDKDPKNQRRGSQGTWLMQKLQSLRRTHSLPDAPSVAELKQEDFPTFADVAMGTSLRQQKQLFSQQLKELVILHTATEQPSIKQNSQKVFKSSGKNPELQTQDLLSRLQRAQEEVDALRQELNNCQQHLDAKYKAIQILQTQVYNLHTEQTESASKVTKLNKNLQEEVNKLHFELEYQQGSLMNSQQTWMERFNRTSQENNALMHAIEEKSVTIRQMQAENAALRRERDELIAQMDVQERKKYESLRSYSSDDSEYNTFTCAELAVLGACHCREQSPEPCSCAKAAANMKKEFIRLKAEIDDLKNQREEAVVTTDAYRIAFEEQLARNRGLMQQLTSLVSSTSQAQQGKKARGVLAWLVKQLNEDSTVKTKTEQESSEQTEESSELNDWKLIEALLEVISDRTEALTHQRLAARMLASRTKELEEKLTGTSEDQVFDKEKH